MILIDVHSHMDFDDFNNDRKNIFKQMKLNNIITLSNTTSFQNFIDSKKLFKGYEDVVKICAGLYPEDAHNLSEKDLNTYISYLKKNKDNFIAIGEVGLDRHCNPSESEFEKQVHIFKNMLELALELNKPIIIHTRKAEEDVLKILEEYLKDSKYRKVILHCFSGKKKYISKIKDLRISCSIPMIITNTKSFQDLVQNLPANLLLVETDSPFLNPSKERNTPLNIPVIYDKIAEIKGLNRHEIENIIYNNYMKIFL